MASVLLTIFLILLTILIIYIIIIFNSLISLKNNISKSWSNIDVLLKQRSEEIPNLVETVKGYMKHEKSLLLEITKERTSLINSSSLSEKAKVDNAISSSLKTIFAVSEKYPKLRANENFLKLQNRITGLENELSDRREFYNDSVTIYNTRIQSFPDLFIAKVFNFNAKELFRVLEEERKVVKTNI
ncbi:LemA family protein [Candidatus Woesearchaeota archaeon]|nr:LemA family protein [Candidatus Woesearchaeota archaeon]